MDEGLMLRRRGRNAADVLRRGGGRDFVTAVGYFARRQAIYNSPRALLRRGRPIRVHTDLRLEVLPGDAGIGRELRAFGVHEPILTHALRHEIAAGETVVDIGANIGYYTLLLRKAVGDSGRVVAIEPSPDNYRQLLSNLALNEFTNIDTLHAALSNSEGVSTLHISSKSNWCTLLPRTDSEYRGTEPVQTLTLEGVAQSFGLTSMDAVRMDIEGYEFVAIDGIKPALQRFRPRVYMELHADIAPSSESVDAFWDALDAIDYAVDWIVPRCLDVNIPSYVSEVARYGWRYGTPDLLDRFSVEDLRANGDLKARQFSVKLVPREQLSRP
jgi:FkbM family methyltransferase